MRKDTHQFQGPVEIDTKDLWSIRAYRQHKFKACNEN